MSEIPFVTALGDALEQAVSADLARPARSRRRRLWLPRGRGRLLIALAVLAIGGAAVADTLQSPTQLAAGAADCSYGTSNTSPGDEGVPLDGLSPVAACQAQYRRTGPVALARPGVKFVVCQQTGFYVDVIVADGRPNQCQRLRLSPLPPAYATGAARVAALERGLGALQHGHDCITAPVLVHEVQGLLTRLGFTGWRPTLNQPPVFTSGGPCAQFPGTDTQPSDPYLALNPARRTVMIATGPALSTVRLRDAIEPQLIKASGRRCLSPTTARTLTRQLLAPRHWTAKFAVTAELAGQRFDAARQLRYDRGCTVVVDLQPTADRQTSNVWLNARTAPALRHGQASPNPDAYAP